MIINHTTDSAPVVKKGRLLGHLNRQQNRQRQQSMLMRSMQDIGQDKSL
ncbi:MAG: hypothetical protein AAGI69_04945 [Cyanobacteria bacterium P01_H01_bin.21]